MSWRGLWQASVGAPYELLFHPPDGPAQLAALNGHLDPGMAVLTKPFAMDDLAAKIRALIEE